jgi:hypothetical protein
MSRVTTDTDNLLIPAVATPAGGSHISVTLTPAEVAAATAAYQNVTVAGLVAGTGVIPMQNPIANATALVSAKCATTGTLALQFVNPTAGALTPTTGTYTFLLVKQG